ncbi:MAG: hypothetical protein ACI9F9_000673 [Candidatus Paceibacteria bacterium]|jgi:hypothetical protein
MNITTRHLGLSLLALITLSSAGSAAQPDVIKVSGLGVLHGAVQSWDPVAEVLVFVTNEGKRHTISADKLDRHSAYKLAKTKADVKNAADLIKLGNFARTVELFAIAGRHYNNAIKLDESLTSSVQQEQATNRKLAADYCMRQAREAADKRDLTGAEKWLTTLVNKLPDEPLAKEAATILDGHYKKNHEAMDDALEAKYKVELEKDLKKGKSSYDRMLENLRKGLTNTSSKTVQRHFEAAWKDGQKALSELDKVQKSHAKEDSDLSELFDGYRVLIRGHMVDAQLNLAAHYSTRSSYNDALAAANLALSIDARNERALAARARIEEASSRGGIFRRWW